MTKTHADRGGFDVHTHLIPPAVIALAERGAYGMSLSPEQLNVCAHGVPLRSIDKADLLLKRLEDDGLDAAVVSVPPPLFRPDLSPADRHAYSRAINDGLLEGCLAHGRRLRPLAYLPAEDPELAARIAADLDDRWAGAVIGTELGGLLYSAPAYDPLWQVLSDRALSVFLHPGSSPDNRLQAFYLSNLLGNPVETTIAAAHLVFADVMGRYPHLKIVLAHGGGCVAALGGRWQRGADTGRPGVPQGIASPNESLRRFYVDSLVHSPAVLRTVLTVFGEDKVVLGSDWPFPMGAPSADHDIGFLDEDLRRRIRVDNAVAAFGERLRAISS